MNAQPSGDVTPRRDPDEQKEPERTFAAALLEIRSKLRDLDRTLQEVKTIAEKVKSRQ